MWTYGGILLSIILLSIFMIKVSLTNDVERGIVSSEGKLNSFVNYASLLKNGFDASIEPLAQRAAYELGLKGGTQNGAYWTDTTPSMEDLKKALGTAIADKLPEGETKGNGRSILWGESTIKILEDLIKCGSTASSKCFFIDGQKSIYIYEEDINTMISFEPYEFDTKVDSSYLKLLSAGRAIMEEEQFNALLDNAGTLFNAMLAARTAGDERFVGLEFKTFVVDDNTVEVTLYDRCYPPSYYCLAPLEPGETGFDPSIPYDYVKLVFKYNKKQTGYAQPDYDFSLSVDPFKDYLEVTCS